MGEKETWNMSDKGGKKITFKRKKERGKERNRGKNR